MVHDKNPHIKFASDQEYQQLNCLTETQLIVQGKYIPPDEDEEEKEENKIVFKEYSLITEYEDAELTDLYVRELQKLKEGKMDEDEEEDKIEEDFLNRATNT